MPLIPPKLCAYCREPFTPRQETATRSGQQCCRVLCARRLRGERMRGQVPVEAVQAKKAAGERRTQETLRQRFGSVTAREAEIFALGRAEGYDVGYLVAYHRTKAWRADVGGETP